MRKLRSTLVLLMTLLLGFWSVLPQEDMLETEYDESESLPYEGTLSFSESMPEYLSQLAVEQDRTSTQIRSVAAAKMESVTTGYLNTATGKMALWSNTTGSDNTATGNAGLYFNTAGNYNTATGELALEVNSTGSNNTAVGVQALSLQFHRESERAHR